MRIADLALRLLGATSGEQIIKAAAATSGAITLPAGTTDFSATGGAGQVVKQVTAGGPFTVGLVTGANVTISDTAPASPANGDLWWDSVGTQLYVRYNDGTSSQWVTANTATGAYLPLAGGTSGGIPYYSSTSSMASSATLTANALVKGGGAGAAPVASTATVDGSGNLTVTGGVVGTATNNNAAAGNVGEYIASNISTPVSLTSGTPLNLTTVSLTAGDWDVSGAVKFTGAGVITDTFANLSTTSVDLNQNNLATNSWSRHQVTYGSGAAPTEVPAPLRLSLSATTTVYLVAYSSFGSTCTAIGILRARRMR